MHRRAHTERLKVHRSQERKAHTEQLTGEREEGSRRQWEFFSYQTARDFSRPIAATKLCLVD